MHLNTPTPKIARNSNLFYFLALLPTYMYLISPFLFSCNLTPPSPPSLPLIYILEQLILLQLFSILYPSEHREKKRIKLDRSGLELNVSLHAIQNDIFRTVNLLNGILQNYSFDLFCLAFKDKYCKVC